ncbi:MAG: 50S ribosomal protein L35 [Candidatus Omnitrophica bacterium]|nr:50S ribosomal protein L35 [Candidatus Omnitrophota bacterium]MBU1128309.1 50S ribosomal protein L35 [Candidatus Omnitrophota bacterium]MBU1784145.1 50S ribosomal protein L35 [Candidatus Omnitrophota bacterium]MBU1851270.1 50S ribosomal protein L35 [Candidatus Omnitrophota bacterium]
MPKMKTHKGAKKRVSFTKSGKIKRTKSNKSHILTKKTTKRKRNLRRSALVDKTFENKISKILPYG